MARNAQMRVRVKDSGGPSYPAMYTRDSLTGLVNTLSGLGTARDKAIAGSWSYTRLEREQAHNAYRSNWMARKAVDIPAFDMMRAGWQWQAEAEAIEGIEAEEKRHDIAGKMFRALKLARLDGGSAIIIGDGVEDPSQPLDARRIGRGGLKFITVVSKDRLMSGTLDQDPMSPTFAEPEFYSISSVSAGSVRLHPSRVVRFIGNPLPDQLYEQIDQWGDSVLDAINIAIQDATAGQQGIAALIQEAKVDVIKVPGLTQNIATKAYEDRLIKRFGLAMEGKSAVNALIVDAEEDYQQKTINLASLPEAQRLFLQIVSGAADIPATRFLGQAPQGMNATGESDTRNYYDRIAAEQELTLRLPMQKIMDVLVRSALGNYPDDIHFTFESLWQLSEKEQAEIGKLEAEETDIYAKTALVPAPVLGEAVKNRLIERGRYPGVEAAYDEFGEDLDLELNPPDDDDDDDDDGRGQAEGQSGGGERTQDAVPRTLYVRRNVQNAAEIVAWARSQGFGTTLAAEGMHVTVAFSRAPVDWMAVGASWAGDIEVPEGGPRLIERLGPNGEAVVLMFAASELSWRHEEIKRAGASWDWPDYQPHITITYDAEGVDVAEIEPYRGKIVLGPEIFEELDEDWKAKVRER